MRGVVRRFDGRLWLQKQEHERPELFIDFDIQDLLAQSYPEELYPQLQASLQFPSVASTSP